RQVVAEDPNGFPPPAKDRSLTVHEAAIIALAELLLADGRTVEAGSWWEQLSAQLTRRGATQAAADLLRPAAAQLAARATVAASPVRRLAIAAFDQLGSEDPVAHFSLGHSAYLCGDRPFAIDRHERALRLAREHGDEELVVTLLQNLVTIAGD